MMSGLLEERQIIFTAQSKRDFFCRDVVCQYVFEQGGVPLNPFRAFDYFLSDRVPRDDVRIGNNNLIRLADELWIFGISIADGVLFEIEYAHQLAKPVRFFTIGNRIGDIQEVGTGQLVFEAQLIQATLRRIKPMNLSMGPKDFLLAIVRGENPEQPSLFDWKE